MPRLAKATVAASGDSKAASAGLKISGTIILKAGSGQQIAPGEQADTLVYFVPASGGARAKPGNYNVYTHHRDFSPAALAIPQGSTVTFVNLDDVRHNVFSVTPGTTFDLGYQASGQKASHVFGHAGMVLISCNVHRSMELDVMVVPSAYSVKARADGGFVLAGLPAGRGTLTFWNPRALPLSMAVTLPLDSPIRQSLKLTREHMTVALNSQASP
jgi:plastocyanin